jgi:hypothetical protein
MRVELVADEEEDASTESKRVPENSKEPVQATLSPVGGEDEDDDEGDVDADADDEVVLAEEVAALR